MSKTLLALVKSIAITTVISGIIGLAAYFAGFSFLLWSVIAFITQFTVFYLFNTYIEYKTVKDLRVSLMKQAEIEAQNSMAVECASCKKENVVNIFTNKENRFICGHCNVKNSVYLLTETAVVTEPMYETNPIPNTASTNGL